MKRPILMLAILLQLATCFTPASAQMAKPAKFFTEPVPETLRVPYADFLSQLGVKDSAKMISETGFGHIRNSETIGFRIEDKSVCDDDRCLTIIGRVVEQRLIAETMFFAGATANMADTQLPFLGIQNFPYIFYSSHGNVMLIYTPEGWVVYLGN